jgi:hypothetical protein
VIPPRKNAKLWKPPLVHAECTAGQWTSAGAISQTTR